MRKLILFISLFGIGQFLMAQAETNYEVAAFDRIEVSHNFKVFLEQGNEHTVTAIVKKGSAEDMVIDVVNNTLVVKIENKSSKSKNTWKWRSNTVTVKNGNNCYGGSDARHIEVYITCPNLKSLDISGAVVVENEKPLNFPNIDIEASGASKASLDLISSSIELDLSGASNIHLNASTEKSLLAEVSGASKVVLNGETDYLELDCSGASNISAGNLNSNKAVIETSGASHISLGYVKTLDVDASGASHVNYKADNDAAIIVDKSGGSAVIKKN